MYFFSQVRFVTIASKGISLADSNTFINRIALLNSMSHEFLSRAATPRGLGSSPWFSVHRSLWKIVHFSESKPASSAVGFTIAVWIIDTTLNGYVGAKS